MNESKILRTACDPKWYAHAYSEYLADVAQNVSNFMAAIQEALTFDRLDDTRILEILDYYDINPNARFIIGEYGSVTAATLIRNVWDDIESPEGYVSNHAYSVDEALSIIRGTWTQSVISSNAFESYATNIENGVDRVSKFIQGVQARFSIDDSVRDTIAYYQSMISASNNVDDFVDQFLQSTGVNTADDTNDPLAYYNSDLYKYTGNTPGMALDFDTATKAVVSSVGVAAKAIKGIFSLAKKGISWLFKKAKRYVVDTLIDPAVCEYIDNSNDNDGYIDGFAWYGQFRPNIEFSHFYTSDQLSSVFSGFYDKYAEKWIKIKLKVGEFLFRVINESNDWQCYFKPAAIDTDYFKENYTGSLVAPSYSSSDPLGSIEEFVTWLEKVMDNVQPVSKDATKNQLYRGFAFGTLLVQEVMLWAFIETFYLTQGTLEFNYTVATPLRDLSDFFSFAPIDPANEVTNAKLVLATSGNPNRSDNINNYYTWASATGVQIRSGAPIYSMRTTMTDLISIWAMCRQQRELYPIDYTFVPYSNNHTSFSPASWRIKSDQEIADTRDNFIENLILATVAVVAIAFIGATIIKISRNAFFKRQQTLGQLENKMWNGGKLTSAERRKYIRYNRRQNASKWLSAGYENSSTSLSNDIQSIIALIQG